MGWVARPLILHLFIVWGGAGGGRGYGVPLFVRDLPKNSEKTNGDAPLPVACVFTINCILVPRPYTGERSSACVIILIFDNVPGNISVETHELLKSRKKLPRGKK